ncbi:MAG TPA: S41 family peptidase, partial [Vicinamibacteria bacterium]|nr:S41 family peptidase [Vicinamibacteria bacterium]
RDDPGGPTLEGGDDLAMPHGRPPASRTVHLPVLLLAGLSLSCGGGSSPTSTDGGGSAGSTNCTTAGQCTFVRDVLQSYYYWYKELPNPDPASFTSPEAYLEAVRYRALDSSFSYVTSKASSDAFYSESQFIGFGLSYTRTSDTELRLVQTFPGSPAAEAGMDRGDYLVSVNGKAVSDLLRTGEISTIFGAEQVGVTADVAWRDTKGRQRSATLAKRLVTIPTVSQTAVLDAGSSRVGYIHFRNFVQPSVEALNTAFTQVRDAGATELVLDLRYNGGGLVSVAQHLGGLIGGDPLVGKVFVQFTHNDKQASRNTAYSFEAKPQALAVARLVVIATQGSASASEAVINGLRPYMDVKVVGGRTYGKPVGQYGFDFCEKVLYPVAFLVTNARGEADYFDGIPADCAAADDVDHPLASPSEASLAEALYVVRNGRCSGRAEGQAEVQARFRERVRPLPTDPWRQMLNAW